MVIFAPSTTDPPTTAPDRTALSVLALFQTVVNGPEDDVPQCAAVVSQVPAPPRVEALPDQKSVEASTEALPTARHRRDTTRSLCFILQNRMRKLRILRTSCYGVRINRTARCPELSLRWRFMRKIQVRLTAPIIPESGRFVNPDFQVLFNYFPERDQALIPPADPQPRIRFLWMDRHAKRLESLQLASSVEGVGRSKRKPAAPFRRGQSNYRR